MNGFAKAQAELETAVMMKCLNQCNDKARDSFISPAEAQCRQEMLPSRCAELCRSDIFKSLVAAYKIGRCQR